MIDYREDPASHVVEITVDGAIREEEFDHIARRLEARIALDGKVRVLEEVRGLGALAPSTFWADLEFGLRHLSDFGRCAVVTKKRWMQWLANAVEPIAACEIRHFLPEQKPPATGDRRASQPSRA
jgi:SpoIIAA-like